MVIPINGTCHQMIRTQNRWAKTRLQKFGKKMVPFYFTKMAMEKTEYSLHQKINYLTQWRKHIIIDIFQKTHISHTFYTSTLYVLYSTLILLWNSNVKYKWCTSINISLLRNWYSTAIIQWKNGTEHGYFKSSFLYTFLHNYGDALL